MKTFHDNIYHHDQVIMNGSVKCDTSSCESFSKADLNELDISDINQLDGAESIATSDTETIEDNENVANTDTSKSNSNFRIIEGNFNSLKGKKRTTH